MENLGHLIALLQNGYQTIGVRFKQDRTGELSQKEYTYKSPLSIELKEGDEVVVESPSVGMTVTVVTRVDGYAAIDLSQPYSYKWVVQKVDTAHYAARRELEKEAFKKLQFAKRVAARDEVMTKLYESLAHSSEAQTEFENIVKRLAAFN